MLRTGSPCLLGRFLYTARSPFVIRRLPISFLLKGTRPSSSWRCMPVITVTAFRFASPTSLLRGYFNTAISVVEVELSASTRATSTLGDVRGTSNPESLWTVVSTISGNNCLNSISTEPKSADKSKVRTGLNNKIFTLLYLCRGFIKVLSKKAINFHSWANMFGFNLFVTKIYLVVLMGGSQNFIYSWPIFPLLALMKPLLV